MTNAVVENSGAGRAAGGLQRPTPTPLPPLLLCLRPVHSPTAAVSPTRAVAAVPTFVGYQGADRVTAFSGADRAMLRRMALELSGHHVKGPGQ